MIKKVAILLLLLTGTTIFSQLPDVTIKDIAGKEYPVHELLDKGHYFAFFLTSST